MINYLAGIIEELGFYKVDDVYTALFQDSSSGSLLKIKVNETEDENGAYTIRFDAFEMDEHGHLIDLSYSCTLDQIIIECRRNLMLVQPKSNNKYAVYFCMTVQVPVDMNELSSEKYYKLVTDECATKEEKIAEIVAEDGLRSLFGKCSINICRTEFSHIDKL